MFNSQGICESSVLANIQEIKMFTTKQFLTIINTNVPLGCKFVDLVRGPDPMN